MPPPLSGAAVLPELGAMVYALPCDHLLVLPKLRHNVTQFQARPVYFQVLQEASAVQRVMGLPKVQEQKE